MVNLCYFISMAPRVGFLNNLKSGLIPIETTLGLNTSDMGGYVLVINIQILMSMIMPINALASTKKLQFAETQ
jgi:hypothetical protein